MTPVIAVAGIVFDADGRVLLIQRGTEPGMGLWTVPGGRLEPGERLVDGVAREVLEETGIVVDVGSLVEVVERIGDGWHYVIHDYLARPIGGTLVAGSDARDARWVAAVELEGLDLTEGLLPVIARARDRER